MLSLFFFSLVKEKTANCHDNDLAAVVRKVEMACNFSCSDTSLFVFLTLQTCSRKRFARFLSDSSM